MGKTWIQSLSRKKLEQRALKKDMVGTIAEIAHSLAGENRFTRQTERFYSVAEHCVRGSRLMAPVFAGAFLLHELSEVYLPDVAGPMKPFTYVEIDALADFAETPQHAVLPDGKVIIRWTDLERQHTHVILDSLGLLSLKPLLFSPEVKAMDGAMLAAEKRDLCGPEPEPWAGLANVDPPKNCEPINPWTAGAAETAFLQRFQELFA